MSEAWWEGMMHDDGADVPEKPKTTVDIKVLPNVLIWGGLLLAWCFGTGWGYLAALCGVALLCLDLWKEEEQ